MNCGKSSRLRRDGKDIMKFNKLITKYSKITYCCNSLYKLSIINSGGDNNVDLHPELQFDESLQY
jgi:hypothetical protein